MATPKYAQRTEIIFAERQIGQASDIQFDANNDAPEIDTILGGQEGTVPGIDRTSGTLSYAVLYDGNEVDFVSLLGKQVNLKWKQGTRKYQVDATITGTSNKHTAGSKIEESVTWKGGKIQVLG